MVPWIIIGILWVVKIILLEYLLEILGVGMEPWFGILKIFYLVSCSTVVYMILWHYIYSSSILKIGLAQIACEVNYCIVIGIVLAIFNSLENREELMGYAIPFMLPDLLILPVIYIFVKIELYFLEPLLSWAREYEPKHRKIAWIAVLAYIVSGIITSFQGFINVRTFDGWIMIPIFTVSIAGNILGFWAMARYCRKTREDNFSLYSHVALMENYSQLLNQQMPDDKSVKQMNTLINQINNQDMTQANEQLIWNYVEELKKRYKEIQAGIYCQDWLVDGILCHITKLCQENEIGVSFSFQKYHRGNISEEDIAEILYWLLLYCIREILLYKNEQDVHNNRHQPQLLLQASAVKNQLIMNLLICSKKSEKRLKHELKCKLSSKLILYHGETTVRKMEGQKKQIVIQLQKEMKIWDKD